MGGFDRIGEFAKRVGRSVSTERREEFIELMDAADRAGVITLVMAHKDRLLAVVRAFSCRPDGLRRYVKELQRADLAVEGVR